MFVVVLVVRGDEWKMILSIAICHPHESAAWAACELWQANERKTATGLKGEFLGCFEVLGFSPGTLGYIHHHPPPPLPWPHITHCCVGTDALSQ